MPWLPWLKRLHREEELDRELRAHLDLEAEDQQAAGTPPEEARYAAQRALGNTGLIKEETRVTWGWTAVEHLQQDLRYAGRMMRKSPGFTVVAVASLALGIGANTAIFSLINAVLIRPLPGVAEPERLVRLTNGSYSYPKLEALRAQGIFAQTVGFDLTRFTAEVNGTTQKIQTVLASGDYYAALGVRPMLGRVLMPEDERTRAAVAVLSHGFWTRVFSADESVLGKSLRVNGLTVTIVGVTPPEFRGVVVG